MKKVLLTLMFSCAAFAAHAMSFDVPAGNLDVYSSMRFTAMYQDITNSANYRDFNAVKLALQTNSRVGFKWSSEDLFMQTELGLGSNATLRLVYGGYKLNGGEYGTIRIGQFAAVADAQTIHSRRFNTDDGIAAFGSLANVRRPGIGYDYKGLTIQLLTLADDSANYTGKLPAAAYHDVRYKELVPRIELAYKMKGIPLTVFGSYAYFTADALEADNDTKDFNATAYHLGLAFTPNFDKAYARLSGFYAVNAGLYGVVKTGDGKGGTTNLIPDFKANGSVRDATTYGGGLSLGYKATAMTTFEVGGGYQSSSSQKWVKDDNNMGFYANATIKAAKGIMITPEVNYVDFMKNSKGQKDAKVFLVGAQFRVDI